MVQTTFTVGSATALATALGDISGVVDAAINTAYSITMTAGVSLTATVSLEAGSSVTLEGPYPFIVPAFAVTGTVVTDLNLTGAITLDNGVLDNVALTSIGGTVVAGLLTGTVLGTTGDGGDSAINSGTILSSGTFAAVQFDSGTIQNGWNGPPSALISGVPIGIEIETSGLVRNGGTIIATGPTSAAVFLGAGTVDNGQIGDAGALMSGVGTGVDITGAGVISNDGTIIGSTYGAVYLGSGLVTNGQIGVVSALIDGGPAGSGVSIDAGAGTVVNDGTIIGGGTNGVYLGFGGTLTNGGLSDTAALVSGAAYGLFLAGPGSLLNYGIVQATGSNAAPDAMGARFDAGGTIENLTTSALIGGLQWGVLVEGAAGFVTNLGTIQAASASGLGVDLTAGGTVVNGLSAGAAATIIGGASITGDGVRISAGAVGAGAVVLNDGTIEGTVGVDFQSGATEAAGTLTNDGLIESTSGTSGDAVVFGAGTERLVLQSAGAFIGDVLGGVAPGSSTTLELAGGTRGTLSGLANNGGTVTDTAGSFVFSDIGTIAVDPNAAWTVTAPGALNTLDNAGAIGVSGGAVTVTGSLTNSGSLAIGNETLIATTGLLSDQGVITVGPGGLLKADGGGIAAAGTPDIRVGGGVAATLDVGGAGATVNTGGHRLEIGSSGQGSVLVGQGGTILAGTQFASDEAIDIGGSAGATGALTVTDPGSRLLATGQLSVGLGGYGSLLIENQATAATGGNTVDKSEGFDVGQLASGSGDATVTGKQSLLSNTGRFVVGDAGLGNLSIQAGGTVITSPGTVAGLAGAVIAAQTGSDGSSVTVTGTGSDWQIAGPLDVGQAATGLLSIDNGATVTAATLDAGTNATGAGVVAVSGANTGLTTTGSLAIGDAGSGELSILNNATVNVGGDLDAGSLGGSGNIDVENATLNVAGNLNLGAGGSSAILTVGPAANVTISGDIIGGPDGVINQFAAIDPASLIDQTVNLDFTGTQPYTTEIDGSTVNIGQGHTVTLETPSIFGGTTINLGASSDTKRATLVLNAGSISSDSSVVFSNPLDTLVIGVDKLGAGTPLLGQFDATIGGFQAGDQIIVDTAGAATFSLNGSVLSVIESGSTLGVLAFDTPAAAQAAATSAALVDHVLCFLTGTLIATQSGQTPVERLKVGDMARTAGGQVRAITWIGEGRVLATRGRRNAATPVIVRKGALGPNVPHADLRVTKGHSFFIDGVLIPVEFLVNHRSILWDDRAQEVSVHHIELETHDVLLANGAPAESYRDDGNRWLFRNFNSGWTQPPKPPCAPVLTGGPVVDAVWRRLLDATGVRPAMPLTDDPDLHLVVDGVRVEAACVHETARAKPGEAADDVYVFALPARPGQVRVVSRAAVPQELGIARDPRLLGVAVRRIAVRRGTRFRVIGAGHKRLADGFHPFEAASGVRWTDGEAVLPAAMFEEFAGAVELVVHLAGTARYIDDGARRRSVA